MLSSWSKIAAFDWEFDLGIGKATAVRRPSFAPVESLMYIMPKAGHGETAVAMCLREDDLEQLIQDEK
jgi:hypothetical protein